MRLVRSPGALAAAGKIDENAAILDLHWIGRNAVLLETGLACTAAAMKFPIMPGADEVFAIQPALAERPADMVAHIRNRAECPILD
jgi:hypothetical protein